jgi:hypothetical protein
MGGQPIAAALRELRYDTVFTKEADGAGCHPGLLHIGFTDVALIVCEETAKVLVAEATDSERWIGNRAFLISSYYPLYILVDSFPIQARNLYMRLLT